MTSRQLQRQFTTTRPNQLWVTDITYFATWAGFFYVAFVIDVFARRIVGWRVASTMSKDLVLDILEQAFWSCTGTQRLIRNCDRGSQYLSIRYSERLAEAGVESSVIASVTRTITLWLSRSTVCTKPR